ncbi:hypothetical protein Despr_0996 [Desulfobulbus propionicus DSM 2032]|uniref:Uncharacterized protein n=1 Tax=Desulfobulbus propionicus (strain ATCC 33891 / DSM 2032 / VKM B-1956 / 1pr3) TaxID=577650 RepID=A0A7U3YKT3_DESPD|nr:hypothetical protein Despr_0996 [Desulfobulbus propionicus DSM 2032]
MNKRTNYKQEKRMKELEKQKKKEAKKERKLNKERMETDGGEIAGQEEMA